jgi:hypothetical protein
MEAELAVDQDADVVRRDAEVDGGEEARWRAEVGTGVENDRRRPVGGPRYVIRGGRIAS